LREPATEFCYNRSFAGSLIFFKVSDIVGGQYSCHRAAYRKRKQESIKREVNQVPYEFPDQLERAIADFVDYYNYRRYHKALGNVTPADVLYGRREQILQRRKEVQIQTINRRRDYNRDLRELVNAT
jgi:hypothetical protein